ncbi:hypothetical protein ACMZ6G_00290 [Klebsiella pneumoniae]|uniref:hypothetical protein n=1 Tax=Klebsiella pneumoniae TaxID=573 RepID=UPI0039EF7EFB
MTDITELAQRLKLEVHRAVSNFNPQMNIKTRDLKELVEALEKAQQRIIELVARKEKRLPVPYAYLRESDGQIQISIGAERPSDRSGGYATPWFPIYTAAGIKVEAE